MSEAGLVTAAQAVSQWCDYTRFALWWLIKSLLMRWPSTPGSEFRRTLMSYPSFSPFLSLAKQLTQRNIIRSQWIWLCNYVSYYAEKILSHSENDCIWLIICKYWGWSQGWYVCSWMRYQKRKTVFWKVLIFKFFNIHSLSYYSEFLMSQQKRHGSDQTRTLTKSAHISIDF